MNTLILVAFTYFTEALLYSLYMFCLYDIKRNRQIQAVTINTMIMSFACEVFKNNDAARLFLPLLLFVIIISFLIPAKTISGMMMVTIYTLIYVMGLLVTEALAASVVYFVIDGSIRSLDLKQYVMVCMIIKAAQFFILTLLMKGGVISEMVNWQDKKIIFKGYKQDSRKGSKNIQRFR